MSWEEGRKNKKKETGGKERKLGGKGCIVRGVYIATHTYYCVKDDSRPDWKRLDSDTSVPRVSPPPL